MFSFLIHRLYWIYIFIQNLRGLKYSTTFLIKLKIDFGSERQMGPENHYEATHEFECPNCDDKIFGSFNIGEYPVGVINYTEVELEGAQVIRECNSHIDLHDKLDRYDEST